MKSGISRTPMVRGIQVRSNIDLLRNGTEVPARLVSKLESLNLKAQPFTGVVSLSLCAP